MIKKEVKEIRETRYAVCPSAFCAPGPSASVWCLFIQPQSLPDVVQGRCQVKPVTSVCWGGDLSLLGR